MIKILFDHQIFSEQIYGGISRYFANLATEINKREDSKVNIAVLYVKNYYLRDFRQFLNNKLGRWLLRRDDKRYYWNKKFSKTLLTNGHFDIFHATYYSTYSLKYNKKPLVVTIHDMIHENSPEMFIDSLQIIEEKKIMMEQAAAIIAISHFTKQEIERFYPHLKNKITVIHHGLPKEAHYTLDHTFKLPENYILFVGERGNYKNFKVLAEAVKPFFKNNQNFKLLATGGGVFKQEEINYLNSLGIYRQCVQLSATDLQLKMLYQNAKVFVYPSSQEGFGLPMLEAFRNNCPVACSNQSCLPEIGGHAAAYFNPENKIELLEVIELLVNSDEKRKELIELGQQQLSMFTMENCINKTLELYQSLKS